MSDELGARYRERNDRGTLKERLRLIRRIGYLLSHPPFTATPEDMEKVRAAEDELKLKIDKQRRRKVSR
jgi:hypothetical protein